MKYIYFYGGEGKGGKPGRGKMSWQTNLNHFFSQLVLWNSSMFLNIFNTVWNGIWFIFMMMFLLCLLEKPRGAICDCVLIKAFFWGELLETGHKFFSPRAAACSFYSWFPVGCVSFSFLPYPAQRGVLVQIKRMPWPQVRHLRLSSEWEDGHQVITVSKGLGWVGLWLSVLLRVSSVTRLSAWLLLSQGAKEEFVLQKGPVRNFWKPSWHQVEQVANILVLWQPSQLFFVGVQPRRLELL